jgi:tartrate-resistant acid phosphatase type 5
MKAQSLMTALLIFLFLQTTFADLNIIAVGDTGKGNDGQYQVGAAMTQDCLAKPCDLALLLGDNIYDTGLESADDPQMIEKFEKPYAQFPVPFYVALGNHDYGKFANEWHKGDYQIEYSKKNPKFILPSYYYSFERENVLFIVLDTSRLFHDYESKEQIQFVKETLAKNTKKWVVMVGHHPYVSNGKHGNAGKYDGWPFSPMNGKVIKKLVEDTCASVDLYISGHDHSLQTFADIAKCPKTTFVVSGSGASGSKLEGKNPSKFQSNELGYSKIQVSEEKMQIQHLNVFSIPLHTWAVTKQ